MKLKINYRKIGWISLCTVIFAILNGYFIFPKILKFVLTRNLQLRPGSQMRPLFEKIPFPLIFKAYIFNVTNSIDVISGSKPILKEIGPYIFEEWKERFDIVDDTSKDTISYTMRNRFIFRPDLSNGLTGDEIVTFPNLIIFGSVMAVLRDRAPMLPLVIKAMKGIFNDPKTPFIQVKVMDMFFNGVGFNCDGNDFSVKAVCAAIKSEGKGVVVHNETFFYVSIFGDKNNTDIARFTVFRGIKDIKNLGRILTIDGDSIQSIWDGDECNKYVGTDSTIFPPFLKPEEGLWTFTPDICMSLQAHYVGKASYAGLPTSTYSIDFGDFMNQPEKQCYCQNPPEVCPPRGTIDLMPCVGSPIYGSKPHFLDADPELLKKVEGLSPNKSAHDVFVNFESVIRKVEFSVTALQVATKVDLSIAEREKSNFDISGTPLEGYKRLQFSIEMEPIEGFEIMSNLTSALLPIIWIEEGVQLNKTYTNLLKYQLFLAKKFNFITKWIGIVGGGIGLLISAFMIHGENSKKAAITAMTIAANGKKADDEKTLESIKYINDKDAEVSKNGEEK